MNGTNSCRFWDLTGRNFTKKKVPSPSTLGKNETSCYQRILERQGMVVIRIRLWIMKDTSYQDEQEIYTLESGKIVLKSRVETW